MYIVELKNGSSTVQIHGETEWLLSGKIVKGINTIDSFTFTILPSNIGFNLLSDFKTLVNVYNTNKSRYDFRGRVLYSTAEMDESGLLSKTVVCESYVGFLCDSQQLYVPEKRWTVGALFDHIIDTHNSMVEPEKQFFCHYISETEFPYVTSVTCEIPRENTWEVLKKLFLDVYGGELDFRCVEGVDEDGEPFSQLQIGYKEQIGEPKSTEIALSKNLKSIARERNPSDLVTRLIPLGAKKGDTEERVSRTDVGIKPYVDDDEGVAAYGVHVGYAIFDDITDVTQLTLKAFDWFKSNKKVPVNYSITALDLSLLGLDVDDFEIGNTHPIKNHLLGIDDSARIVKKTIDICEEVEGSIEIGEKFKSLTEIQLDQKKEASATVNIVKNMSGNFVGRNDNESVVKMLNNATSKVSLIGDRFEVQSENLTLLGGRSVFKSSAGEYSAQIDNGIVQTKSPSQTDISGKHKVLIQQIQFGDVIYGLYLTSDFAERNGSASWSVEPITQ